MVILSEFHMGQYRDRDHREDALRFRGASRPQMYKSDIFWTSCQ